MAEKVTPQLQSDTSIEPDISPAPPARKTKTSPKSRTKRLPPHAVVLHNDPVNGMDYVVGVLRRVFKYSTLRCVRLMLVAHFRGRVAVWTGSLEVAELKMEQLRAAGPDPRAMSRGAHRLTVSVEKLP